MKLLNIAFISALALIPFAAQATDLPSKTNAPNAPVASLLSSKWDGFYAGALVGHSSGNDYGREEAYDPDLGAYDWEWYQNSNPSGSAIGGVVGFNKSVSNGFVLGVEADLEKRFQTATAAQRSRADDEPDLSYLMKTSVEAAMFARVRLGYLINAERTMLFLSGGVALADINRTFTINRTGSATNSGWESGWTVGGGVEHFINDRWSMMLDYRFSQFGERKLNVTDLYNSDEDIYHGQRFKENVINFGLNYHF